MVLDDDASGFSDSSGLSLLMDDDPTGLCASSGLAVMGDRACGSCARSGSKRAFDASSLVVGLVLCGSTCLSCGLMCAVDGKRWVAL